MKDTVLQFFSSMQPGQQIKFKIDSFQNATFLILDETLWCDYPLESSLRDDSNEGHIIGLG